MNTTVALRTALIWHDEVMDDVVIEKPTKITVGSVGKPTFIVPDLGLPKSFAIVRPGNRGYLLTLGERMRGTICIDGQQKDVAEFVRHGDGEVAGGFRATPISGRDWGVIELDGSGDYKLFFQFVPVDEPVPFFTKPVLFAGIAGYLITIAVLAGYFYWHGITTDWLLLDSATLAELTEATFRGLVIASAALGLSALMFWVSRQEGESQASLGFSVMLHAALVLMTYQLYDGSDPFVWPGSRALTANYLATRLEKPPDPPKPTATVGEKTTGAAAMKSPEPPKKTATRNAEGAAGGKGEHERMRDKNATDEPVSVPKVGVFEDRNRKVLDSFDQNLTTRLDKFNGIKGDETRRGDLGFGHGLGTGVGAGIGTGTTRGSKGTGTGGGGNAEGDFVSDKGRIDTGKERPGGGTCAKPPCGTSPKEVKVAVGEAEGDIEGLTAEEINRVVKARAGVFRACYQKELNRSPGLGGKLVMHFVIGGDGIVKSAKTGGGTTMHNEAVEECVNRQIMSLHFPAKGGISNVNYPFVFQPGG
ncbi:MAG: AgmX/PglI C-terminal domain-containing protein [Acidobacteriota bacterium]